MKGEKEMAAKEARVIHIEERLLHIQQKLKAPKNQYNKLGDFNYRSCEDILEAVKPILAKEKCILTISDQILSIGDRFYVQALAKLTDVETHESVSNSAFAREETERKGNVPAQITGGSSSYARKYCLSGMFLLDDNKDADTNEAKQIEKAADDQGKKTQTRQQAEKQQAKLPTEKVNALLKKCEHDGVPVDYILKAYKVKSLYQMTEPQWMNCVEYWEQIMTAVKGASNGEQGKAD